MLTKHVAFCYTCIMNSKTAATILIKTDKRFSAFDEGPTHSYKLDELTNVDFEELKSELQFALELENPACLTAIENLEIGEKYKFDADADCDYAGYFITAVVRTV
jgi:hypothetical protein